MEELIRAIRKLQKSEIRVVVERRLAEFESFGRKRGDEWFSELCFCILTANSRARTAIAIQKELCAKGFCTAGLEDLKSCIRCHRHRFYNNKACYILEARTHQDIKDRINAIIRTEGEAQAREWLVRNIKGLGYKEASHFLRNTGAKNLAILDRHILNLFKEHSLIKEKPKSLTKKRYLEIERIFQDLAGKLKMSAAELDLYMWCMKTGEVLK